MPMTAAMSRSAALTAIPSAKTRQASFTTGKNNISTMSLSDNFVICIQVQPHQIQVKIPQSTESQTHLHPKGKTPKSDSKFKTSSHSIHHSNSNISDLITKPCLGNAIETPIAPILFPNYLTTKKTGERERERERPLGQH